MTPAQTDALAALIGRALTAQEQVELAPMVQAGQTGRIGEYLSARRLVVTSHLVSARGLAERIAGGPLAAEAVLLKLEGARDSMLASADQQQRVLGSLLRRQLGFLAGDGLDFGSPALRTMLDQFAALGILTAAETQAAKDVALRPGVVSEQSVQAALEQAEA